MSQPNFRLFLAIPIPNRYRPVLSTWSNFLKERLPFKKWVHPADYHITLKFLGECTFSQANQIKQLSKTIAQEQEPFSLSIEGLGVFGNPKKPRILWAGISGEMDRLRNLSSKLEKTLDSELGFASENREYNPHITLARNYQGDSFPIEQLHQAINLKEGVVTWTVKEFVLYQSHFNRTPMYQPLASFPFANKS